MSAGRPNRDPITDGPAPMLKLCAACSATFSCGAVTGKCWCDQITLPPEATASLCAQFSDCLCPACLTKAGTLEKGSC